MQQQKLWTRTFIVLMGVNFCSALSFYLIMVKITQYAVDVYDLAPSVAGVTVSAFVIAALLTRLLFGGRIDVWGVKRSLVIGSAVNAAAMALYLLPMGFVPLLLVRAVNGFGFALMSGAAAAGAALVVPRDRYGEGIGYFSMMQALATGVGPFVAIAVTGLFGGYMPMFFVAAAIAALALVSVAVLDMPAREASRSAHSRGFSLGSFIQLSVLPLASVTFLCYLGYSGILSFVVMYAESINLDGAVSLYFVVYAATILLTRPSVGRRIDRKGENPTTYFCLLSFAAGLAVLAFAANGAMLLMSAMLAGFGLGATQSIVQAVIARDTSMSDLGKANSTFFMSMDLGSGVGPIVIGAVIPVIGYSGSYLALAFVAGIAMIVYHFVHGCAHRGGRVKADCGE